jgi:large subunit ribosomal protein L4
MQIPMKTQTNQDKGAADVADTVFGEAFREGLVHQVVNAQLAGLRSGTHKAKSRGEVAGGGKKPWRQKGTGNARAGTIRSPLWRGGGIIFGPQPRSHEQKINKKMRTGAARSILSELVRRDELVVLDDLQVSDGKTRTLLSTLQAHGADDALVVTAEPDELVERAGRNIPHVTVMAADAVSPLALVQHARVVTTEAALRKLEERLQ